VRIGTQVALVAPGIVFMGPVRTTASPKSIVFLIPPPPPRKATLARRGRKLLRVFLCTGGTGRPVLLSCFRLSDDYRGTFLRRGTLGVRAFFEIEFREQLLAFHRLIVMAGVVVEQVQVLHLGLIGQFEDF
jgi:hypothetical protein